MLVLALAGRFAAQHQRPPGAGTLPTHRPLFVVLLAGVALVVVGLTYVPVLALGPIVESLSMTPSAPTSSAAPCPAPSASSTRASWSPPP